MKYNLPVLNLLIMGRFDFPALFKLIPFKLKYGRKAGLGKAGLEDYDLFYFFFLIIISLFLTDNSVIFRETVSTQ